MLFIMQIIVSIIVTVIKYFILFVLFKNNENNDIAIRKLKSTNNGDILKIFFTVTKRKMVELMRLKITKKTTSR